MNDIGAAASLLERALTQPAKLGLYGVGALGLAAMIFWIVNPLLKRRSPFALMALLALLLALLLAVLLGGGAAMRRRAPVYSK